MDVIIFELGRDGAVVIVVVGRCLSIEIYFQVGDCDFKICVEHCRILILGLHMLYNLVEYTQGHVQKESQIHV